MIKLTKPHRAAVYRKWAQNDQGLTYRQFRATVQGGFDCAMVYWSGMWLGIEPDGYTHS
jgi:hypothetical protein